MDGKCLLAALSPKHEMKSKRLSKKVSITLANDLNKDWVRGGHGPVECQLWVYIVSNENIISINPFPLTPPPELFSDCTFVGVSHT